MSYDSKTERLISIKKLAGKAHTSNDKGLSNEALPSGITITSETVFGESITGSPSSTALYTITGKVEYVRFPVTFIAGSDTSSGRHGFELKLPADYESASSNPNAGTYPFQNNQSIQITSGSLQLVPTSFSTSYEAKPYYGGNTTKDSGTQIPVLDARDWYMDYFNGIFFQQDPPGTGDHANNPDYIEAYLYIGNFLSTVVANVDTDTTYSAGDGLDLSSTTFALDLKSGSGLVIDSTELGIDNSILATISGSVFSGHVGVTGSIHSTAELSGSLVKAPALSGSLTHLEDGSSYLVAGTNVTIATGSSGAITISSADTNTDTTYTAGTGLDLTGTQFSVDSSVFALRSGTTFTGDVEFTQDVTISGTLNVYEVKSTLVSSSIIFKSGSTKFGDSSDDLHQFTGSASFLGGLSGSLTHLPDGSSYLVAGSNVQIATGSSGAITISSTDTNTTYSSSDFTHDDLAGFVANEHIDWTASSAGTIHATNYTNTTYSVGDGGLTQNNFTNDLKSKLDGIAAGATATVDLTVSGAGTVHADNYTDTDTTYTAGTGLELSSTEFSVDNSVVATLSGSVFSGHIGVTGSIHSTAEVSGSLLKASALSGSLTHLTDGSSYLIAGTNVQIATGSSGAITVSSTDTNTTYTSSDFTHDDLTGFVANEHIDWTQASAGTIHTSNYTDTNTTYTAGDGLDLGGTEFSLDLKSGSGLTIDSTELSVDDSILATLSGSIFSGHVGVTGSIHSTAEVSGSILKAPVLSGSLTQLEDGTSYLIAGTNVQIVTGSTGAITVSSTDTNTTYSSSDFDHDQLTNFVANEHIDWTASSAGTIHASNYTNTTYTAGDGLDLSGTEFGLDLKSGSGLIITSTELDIDDAIIATLSGSVFSGHVGVTGSIHATAEISGSILKSPAISGSLTHLEDGSSYLLAGSNVTIATGSSGAVTISAAADQNVFSTISVSGQDNVVADASTDTLTLAAGSNVTITTNAASDTITIASTDTNTTYSSSDFTHDDLAGFVANEHIDWTSASAGTIHATNYTNTTYSVGDGGLTQNNFTNDLKTKLDGIAASATATVDLTVSGAGTVHADNYTDTNTTYTAGSGLDLSGTAFSVDSSVVALRTGTTFTGDVIVSGTLTATEIKTTFVSSSIIYESGSTKFGDSSGDVHQFTGSAQFKNGLSGSLTHLPDGSSYLVAGSNVTIATGSAGAITISAQIDAGEGDITAVTAGTGLSGGATSGAATLAIDNAIVATLTGSIFSGHVGVTGSIHSTAELSGSLIKAPALSGSLTHLEDGSSYMVAGSNITIATGSSGAVTISSTDTNTTYTNTDFDHDQLTNFVANEHIDWTQSGAGTIHATNYTNTNTTYTAGDGLDLGGTEFSLDLKSGSGLTITATELGIDDSILATLSGSVFSGHVGVTGSIHSTAEVSGSILRSPVLSGSLTHLEDGSSYLVAGSNVTIVSGSSGAVTISATAAADVFKTISVAGQDNVVADATTDTLTLAAGPNVTITTNATSDTITIASADTNTTYSSSDFDHDQLTNFVANEHIDWTQASAGTIHSSNYTDTNTTYTAGDGLGLSSTTFSLDLKSNAGLKIDSAELAIDNTVVATLSGSDFSGTVKAPALSGSLTKLEDGSSYLIAGSNVTITTGSSGAVTITAAGDIGGSGAANGIATWSGANTLTSDTDFTWNGSLLNVQGDANLNGTVVINQSGADKDFRVESNNKSNAFEVDGTLDMVLIHSGDLSDPSGYGSSPADPDPKSFTDTNFFVSGSIGSRGSTTKGTSVFGGDIVASGSLVVHAGISGSLTQLEDGSSYLIAGTNVQIATGSSGAVTISSTDTNTTYTSSDFTHDDLTGFVANEHIDWTQSGAGTIHATNYTDTNTTYTAGTGLDLSGTEFSLDLHANSGLVIDSTELSIDDSVIATLSGSVFSGHVGVTGSIHSTSTVSGSLLKAPALTGSLTRLEDGTSYLIAGNNIQVSTGSTGAITISSTDTNTQLTQEQVEDFAGSLLASSGTKTGIAVTYDDANGEIDLVVSDLNVAGDSGSTGMTPGDTLTVTGGANVTTAMSGDTLTISSTDTTYSSSDFDHDQLTNFVANEHIDWTQASAGTIHASNYTDNNTTYTAGTGLDLSGTTFSVDGGVVALRTGTTFTGDVIVSGTLTAVEMKTLVVSSSILYKSGSTKFGDSDDDHHHFTGSAHFITGLSGSLTHLEDGSSYLVGGTNVQIVTGSSGAITISSTDTNTTYSSSDFTHDDLTGFVANEHIDWTQSGAGTIHSSNYTDTNTTYTAGIGLDLSGTEFSLDLKSGSGLVIDSTELSIDDSKIATISGSVFSGHVGVTGSIHSTAEISGSLLMAPALSGSLTKLEDGSSYIVAGTNVQVVTGSSGAITISSTDTNTTYTNTDFDHDQLTNFVANEHIDWTQASAGTIHATNYTDTNTTYTAGNGLDLAGTEFSLDLKSGSGLVIDSTELSIDDSVLATLSGSVFSGHVGVTGSIYSTTVVSSSILRAPVLSGSLTHLEDGSSYIVAGNNVQVATGSSGAITISSTDTNTTYVSSDFNHDDLTGFVSAEHINWTVNQNPFVIHAANYTDTNTTYTAGDGLDLSGTTFSADLKSAGGLKIDSTELMVDNSIVATLTGSEFSGNVGIAGTLKVDGDVTFNDSGAGKDFRIETANEDEAFFIDGSADTIYINKGKSSVTTVIKNTNEEAIRVGAAGIIFNEYGHASMDLRVESDSNTHMLFVDAGNNKVGIGTDTPETTLHVQNGSAGTIAAVDNAVLILESNEKPRLQFQSPGAYGGTIVFGSPTDNDEGQIDYDHGSDRFLFKTGGNTKMTILGDNVGIGTTSPSTKLEVVGTIKGSAFTGSLTHLSDGSSYLIAGSNTQITTGSSGAITVSSTDTNTQLTQEQVEDFAGAMVATSGTKTGITVTYQDSTGDMDFVVSDLNVSGDSGTTGMTPGDTLTIAGGTNVSTAMSGDTLTITATDTNTTYSAGSGLDLSGTTFSVDAGAVAMRSGTTFTGDVVVSGTLTAVEFKSVLVSSSIVYKSGSTKFGDSVDDTHYFTGSAHFINGLSGSLTHLEDGSSYLVAGSNVQIATGSSGAITISSTDTNTTYTSSDFTHDDLTGFVANEHIDWTQASAGTIHSTNYTDTNTTYTAGNGLDLGGTEFSLDLKSGSGLIIDSTELSVDDSILATLSGSVFSGHVGVTGSIHSTTTISGSTLRAPVISGSLTHLEDGSSYLIAGSNIQIATGSTGAVTISASGGGSITTQQAGGSSYNNSSTLIFSSSTVADNGGGSITVTPVIGPADDGDYSTGLFSNFNYNTLVGTAIDKFNEVLRSLAPDPAPDLDDMDCNNSAGTTAFLSFGSSNDQSSGSPAYASSGTAAGFSAVDVNGSYAAATSGNDIKKGIYDGTEIITGDLNEDIARHQHNTGVTNYVANAFGNADEGTLKLYVNGSLKHSIVLTGSLAGSGVPGSGTAQQLNANSSGFTHLSQTGSAVQSNNVAFIPFQHRTGRFKVHPDDQRNGFNYAQVVHTIASGDITTNYVEWVNDPDSNALAAAGNAITDIALTGEIQISGVRYATDATANYKVRVSNAYKYVYDNNAITFTVSNCAVSNQAKPTINTGAGETHDKVLHLTGAMDISLSGQFGGSCSASVNVTHPMKSNLSSGGSTTASGFLIWNVSNNSTDQFESFRMENKRLTSGSYNAMSDITGGSYAWDNTLHLSGAADQTDGLIFYNDRLYSATSTLNSGDFRNTADGGSLANGYLSNPNYSGLNSGTKTFFRAFRNETGNSVRDFDLTIDGSGTTIVNAATALNSGRIRVFGKIPGTTGWMDLARAFTYNSSSNGDGGHIGSFDSSLNAANYFSFGTTTVADDDYVMLKIEADAGWTGYASQITVNFPAVGVTAVAAAPAVGNIDCNDSGTAAKLSFGSSKSISGYTNSGTNAGFSAVDINGSYTQTSSGANLRRAVFAGATLIDGEVNESTGASGNSYPANSFKDGHTGSLKLEVNGSVIQTTNLFDLYQLGVTVTTSLNGNGSGFHSITQALNGKDGSNLPDFRHWYRKASYKVTAADQRNGFNYARVIHSIPGSADRETNYVEWINDPDSNALSTASPVFSTFGSNNAYYQSGVKYFMSPTGSLAFQANNCYRNIYSNSSSAISMGSLSNFTVSRLDVSGSGVTNSGANASSIALPALDAGVTDPHLLPIHVTASLAFTRSTSLPNSSIAGGTSYNGALASTVLHPIKSNGSLSTQTKSNFLVYSGSNASNLNTSEQFVQERYRVQSGSYANQASSFATMWNSSISMNDQAGNAPYATGLLIYNSKLISPKKGPSSGDFRDYSEGGNITSALGNPNYSSLTNTVRYYTRHFLNNTTNDTPQITVAIRGDATLVAGRGASYAALGANKNCRVEIKIPGKTGWMDTARASAGSGNVSDGDGGLSGDLDQTIDGSGNSNICTFNGETVNGSVSGAEYIMVSIVAHEDWVGYVSRITISYS